LSILELACACTVVVLPPATGRCPYHVDLLPAVVGDGRSAQHHDGDRAVLVADGDRS
jgi:hypothetical protein